MVVPSTVSVYVVFSSVELTAEVVDNSEAVQKRASRT